MVGPAHHRQVGGSWAGGRDDSQCEVVGFGARADEVQHIQGGSLMPLLLVMCLKYFSGIRGIVAIN